MFATIQECYAGWFTSHLLTQQTFQPWLGPSGSDERNLETTWVSQARVGSDPFMEAFEWVWKLALGCGRKCKWWTNEVKNKYPSFVIDLAKLKPIVAFYNMYREEAGCRFWPRRLILSKTYPLISSICQVRRLSGLYEAKLARKIPRERVHVFAPAFKESDMEELQKMVLTPRTIA